jgi:hypothetical protein
VNIPTNVDLVLSFYDIIWVSSYNEGVHNFDTSKLWVLDGILVFGTIHIYISCKNIRT